MSIKGTFNQPIDNLPPTLLKLVLKDYLYGERDDVSFDQPIDNLPPSLCYLDIFSKFNQLVCPIIIILVLLFYYFILLLLLFYYYYYYC